MANYTTNLELEKPLATEAYDINVFNGNMDKIDAEFIKKLNINSKATSEEALAGTDNSKYITPLSLSSVIGNLVSEIQSAVESLMLQRDKQKYHVGKLVFETSNTNPATYLGFGTWELWGAGRVPVGVDLNDIDFNEVEKTGGSKFLQKHTHKVQGEGLNKDVLIGNDRWGWNYGVVPASETNGGTHIIAAESGTGDSGNVQPYITCYIWKRIA